MKGTTLYVFICLTLAWKTDFNSCWITNTTAYRVCEGMCLDKHQLSSGRLKPFYVAFNLF